MERVGQAADWERVRAYMLDSGEVVADQVERHPAGCLLRSPSLPRVWVLNRLIVTGEPEGPGSLDSAWVEAEAQRLLGGPGHHVRITVLDDVLGERIAAELAPAGWSNTRNVVMAYSGARLPEPGAEAAAEPDREAADRLLARIHAAYGGDPDAEEQLLELGRRRRASLDGRLLVAPPGRPAAIAELLRSKAVGEISSVDTLEAERRRGLGRAVVVAALAVSASNNELTFLEADAGDWPKDWYARLGFATVGAVWELDTPESSS
jgi:GNAT superfamily N-acetyltransferase